MLDGNLCYLQCVTSVSERGEVLRVLPGRFRSEVRRLSDLASEPSEYLIIWFLVPAIADRIAELVGQCPVPEGKGWSGEILSHHRNPRTGVDFYEVVDATGRRIDKIDVEPNVAQWRLPQMWYSTDESVLLVLQHSRDRSWSLADLDVLRAAAPSAPETAVDKTPRHLVMFRSRPAACRADAALREKVPGVASEVIDLPGTGTVAWAVRDPAAFEPDADRDSLEGGSLGTTVRALAREHRGTYDGIA